MEWIGGILASVFCGIGFYTAQAARLCSEPKRREETQEKASEFSSSLAQNETVSWLQMLIDGVQDYSIIMLDAEGVVRSWNAGAERIKGYRPEEIIGRPFTCFFTDRDIQQGKPETFLQGAEEQGRYKEEGWRVRKDGSIFWASVVVTRIVDAQGQALGYTHVLRDSTERKQAEEALRESEARFRFLAEYSTDLVLRLTPGGYITYASPSCRHLLGYDPEEVTGCDLGILLPEGEREAIPRLLGQLRDCEATYAVSGLLRDKSGEERWFETIYHVIHEAETGDLLEIHSSSRDISERKRQEAQIAEQMHEISEAYLQLEALNLKLEALATSDGLTGLHNHRAFQERLEHAFAMAMAQREPVSLILLDVDHFKQYNDTFGHPAGDKVLQQVARRLEESACPHEFLARYGGEEFVIVLPQTDAWDALDCAERFRAAIESGEWKQRPVTASFGVATWTDATQNRAQLIAEADAALYASKKTGRNRVTHQYQLVDASEGDSGLRAA